MEGKPLYVAWSLKMSPTAGGRGATETNPHDGGATAVTLSNTADTPEAGMPATPVTFTSWLRVSARRLTGFGSPRRPSPGRIAPLLMPTPVRVSSNRVGFSG